MLNSTNSNDIKAPLAEITSILSPESHHKEEALKFLTDKGFSIENVEFDGKAHSSSLNGNPVILGCYVAWDDPVRVYFMDLQSKDLDSHFSKQPTEDEISEQAWAALKVFQPEWEHYNPPSPAEEGIEDSGEEEQESRFLPSPPPVPLEAFPPEVKSLLEESSNSFGVPTQIPTACFLSVLSCLVGGARLISFKKGWKEPGNVWIATVARSGGSKTPLANAFFKPIKDLEIQEDIKFQKDWENYLDQMEVCLKQRGKAASAGNAMPARPPIPRKKQAYVDDSTVEALSNTISANPKGVLWKTDELAGMIANMDKYSSGGSAGGGTRSRLLSAYDGQEWKTSRTSNPGRNIHIPHAYVGIFGGIQPDMLPKVFKTGDKGEDVASGFLQRFMLIRSEKDRPSLWTGAHLSPLSENLLARITEHLWNWEIEIDSDGRQIETIVEVDEEALQLYIDWFNIIAQEEFLSENSALLSKLKAQAQRLILLLHCLDAGMNKGDGRIPVNKDTVRRGLLLADWIKEHQVQCWRLFAHGGGRAKQADPITLAIMQVIVENAASIEEAGWQIGNSELFALVEQKMGIAGISNRKMGQKATSLGLRSVLIGNRRLRGRELSQEKIKELEKNVSGRLNVSTTT